MKLMRQFLKTERNVLRFKKLTRKNNYIVVRKSLVYEASVSVGFKCTKYFVA